MIKIQNKNFAKEGKRNTHTQNNTLSVFVTVITKLCLESEKLNFEY